MNYWLADCVIRYRITLPNPGNIRLGLDKLYERAQRAHWAAEGQDGDSQYRVSPLWYRVSLRWTRSALALRMRVRHAKSVKSNKKWHTKWHAKKLNFSSYSAGHGTSVFFSHICAKNNSNELFFAQTARSDNSFLPFFLHKFGREAAANYFLSFFFAQMARSANSFLHFFCCTPPNHS